MSKLVKSSLIMRFAMTKRKFTDEQELEICRRYQEGESANEISRFFATSKCPVLNVLKRNKIKRRTNSESHGGLHRSIHEEICHKYMEGKSSVQLAHIYDVTKQTILKVLREGGIKMRSAKETALSSRSAPQSSSQALEWRCFALSVPPL